MELKVAGCETGTGNRGGINELEISPRARARVGENEMSKKLPGVPVIPKSSAQSLCGIVIG